MKFIREIIGEKRQLDRPVNGTPAAQLMHDAPASGQRSAGSMDGDAAQLEGDIFEKIEELHDAQRQSPKQEQESDDGDSPDLGVSDEVAKFFAESSDQDNFEDFDTELPEEKDLGSDNPNPGMYEMADDVEIAGVDLASEPERGMSENPDPEHVDRSLKEAFQFEEALGENDMAPVSGFDQVETAAQDDHFPQDAANAEVHTETVHPRPEISAFPPRPAREGEAHAQAEPVPTPSADISESVEVPQPAVGRGASRHGRVKTRLLGFNTGMETEPDPMADNGKADAATYTSFPVGWLIVVDGAGRGSAFTLFHGVSTIGRGEDETVRLDFGDNSISRENHASIAYDARQQGFFIGHGGKANIVRRNDRPVLCTEELAAGDHITIGETTLRFVPFCCPDFSWEQETETGRAYANQG